MATELNLFYSMSAGGGLVCIGLIDHETAHDRTSNGSATGIHVSWDRVYYQPFRRYILHTRVQVPDQRHIVALRKCQIALTQPNGDGPLSARRQRVRIRSV